MEKYYIQDTRSYLGNALVWWDKSDNGYTADIGNARIFTKEDAINTIKDCSSHKFRAWLCGDIDNMGKGRYTVIDAQYLNGIKELKINPRVIKKINLTGVSLTKNGYGIEGEIEE